MHTEEVTIDAFFQLQKIFYYNVIIYGTNVSDQTIKNDIRTYDNIRKIAPYKGDNYTTGCLLDFVYFKINHRMIVIDLSKQHVFDANQKAIQ